MSEFLRSLLTADFLPHGHCFFWKPEIVWLHLVSDVLIAVSYYSIPATLLTFARRRRDFPYPWVLYFFGAFIIACGTTHVMNVWTLWIPVYRLDGVIKAATALVSVTTALLLIPLVPRALALRSATDFEIANLALEREVVERERAEESLSRYAAELARSNTELAEFAYVASHDLQEPLRKIVAFGDRLKTTASDKLGDQGRDYLERMQGAAQRMSALIADLLSLSRVSTTKEPFAPVDLRSVLDDALSDLESKIESTGGRVEAGELPTIEADPLQMRQLLQNLIGNALTFHRPDVPPEVRVSGTVTSGHDGRPATLSMTVADNGIGFEGRHLERIFQPFQRLHARSEYEGTGMGLAICKRIAERHHGSITAESLPGAGTTFVVVLPLEQSAPLARAS